MPNHKVDVGDCNGPLSPTSSQGAGTTSTEHIPGKTRRRQSSPVTSEHGMQKDDTRGQRSRTISEVIPTTSDQTSPQQSSASKQPEQQQPSTFHGQQLVMPRRARIMNLKGYDLEVDTMLREAEHAGNLVADAFSVAPLQPPITPESLAELDMARIINNPKLRHDVNFDRELHFRPNFDGSRGELKLKSADRYWRALQGELYLSSVVQANKQSPTNTQTDEHWQGVLMASQKRLPNMFQAIGDILKTLVPDYDQEVVVERLDVALIMREISHGVCDLVDLANWLAKMLKSHCAPMRDDLVDRMAREIKKGATEQQPVRLVNGLRQLLNILEAMKLDVANHQIRHMRSLLVENTVEFQRRYNKHRIDNRKIDVKRAHLWLSDEMEELTKEEQPEATPLQGLTSALLRALLFMDHSTTFPQTFYLDMERVRGLRNEVLNRIYADITRDILIEFAGKRAPKAALDQAIIELNATAASIIAPTGRFADHRENLSAEIMRVTLMLEGHAANHLPFDPDLLEFIERRLTHDLQPCSMTFAHYSHEMLDRLLPKIQSSVDRAVRFSAIDLQDALLPKTTAEQVPTHHLAFGAVCAPSPIPQNPDAADPDEDIVNRFTHIMALHWQIWGEMVYLAPEEEVPTPPASPTIPVAEAVYAPGRKWLPIGVTVKEVPTGLLTPGASPEPEPDAEGPRCLQGSEREKAARKEPDGGRKGAFRSD